MTHHHYTLRPIARADAIEVLLCSPTGVEAVLWRPGAPSVLPVSLQGYEDTPWSVAHMDVLRQAQARNRRGVSVARPQNCRCPQGWHMVLTVVEDSDEKGNHNAK